MFNAKVGISPQSYVVIVAIIQITCFSSFYRLIPTSISKLTIFKFTSVISTQPSKPAEIFKTM